MKARSRRFQSAELVSSSETISAAEDPGLFPPSISARPRSAIAPRTIFASSPLMLLLVHTIDATSAVWLSTGAHDTSRRCSDPSSDLNVPRTKNGSSAVTSTYREIGLCEKPWRGWAASGVLAHRTLQERQNRPWPGSPMDRWSDGLPASGKTRHPGGRSVGQVGWHAGREYLSSKYGKAFENATASVAEAPIGMAAYASGGSYPRGMHESVGMREVASEADRKLWCATDNGSGARRPSDPEVGSLGQASTLPR